jgi:hypothetical protein
VVLAPAGHQLVTDPLITAAQLPMLRRHLPAPPPRQTLGLLHEEIPMHGEPVAHSKPPTELKVKLASLGAYLGSVAILGVLQAVDADHSMIAFLPDWLEAVTLPLVPTGIAWAAGRKAKHTPRPDLPQSQR